MRIQDYELMTKHDMLFLNKCKQATVSKDNENDCIFDKQQMARCTNKKVKMSNRFQKYHVVRKYIDVQIDFDA